MHTFVVKVRPKSEICKIFSLLITLLTATWLLIKHVIDFGLNIKHSWVKKMLDLNKYNGWTSLMYAMAELWK